MASRLRPAANIMVGPFWAESMMFAETFHRVGSMQIAGTARLYQIPFFAAGAYVSKDPLQVGSIAAQDWYKLIAIILGVLGALLATGGVEVVSKMLTI